MNAGSDTSLGDLLRARFALGLTDPGEIREVAALLGLPVGAPPPRIATPRSIASEEAVAPVQVESEVPRSPVAPPPFPSRAPAAPATSRLAVRLEDRVRVSPPAWFEEGPRLRREPEDDPLRGVEPPPLLAPATTRALLAATVAGEAAGGDIDVDRAVDLLARGLPLPSIPRRPVPTLRFGVQILVDRSSSMLPYRADQRRVLAGLQRLAGPDRVQALRFAGVPWRAGPGTPRTWGPYRPPARGTTVLVLGDLGLCRGENLETEPVTAEWPSFVESLCRAGCRPVALVPYPPERWPAVLRTRMKLVLWDHATTLAQVRQARREAR